MIIFIKYTSRDRNLLRGLSEGVTEMNGWHSGNALNLYSRSSRFKYRLGHRLSLQIFFVVLLQSSASIISLLKITTSFQILSNLSFMLQFDFIYRLSQEERLVFRKVIVSVILSKKRIYTCILFRTVSEVELFHCTVSKLLIRKRYYVLFLIPVLVFQ
jgi:hypothetical protein